MENKYVNFFWDEKHTISPPESDASVNLSQSKKRMLEAALAYFGPIKDKTLLDLGCGRGEASIFFASYGAQVISLDSSDVAVENLINYCRRKNINNVYPVNLSAHDIDQIPAVDFVFGSMILHHIDPFDSFVTRLRELIASDGKGFFWENNAQSQLLIWFRQHLVGKIGIPEFSDPQEFPLTTDEVEILREHFNVEIIYPELVYFRLIATYLLRGKGWKILRAVDHYFYQFSKFRSLSYRQYLFLT